MGWAEVKHALNSTLGTSGFKSLDKLIGDVKTVATNAYNMLTNGTYGLSAINNETKSLRYSSTNWYFTSGANKAFSVSGKGRANIVISSSSFSFSSLTVDGVTRSISSYNLTPGSSFTVYFNSSFSLTTGNSNSYNFWAIVQLV